MLSNIPEWVSIKTVAQNLSLSQEMIYKLAQKGELPAVRFGSSWRIHRDDLNQWLLTKRVQTKKTFIFGYHQEILKTFKVTLLDHFGSRLSSSCYDSKKLANKTRPSFFTYS